MTERRQERWLLTRQAVDLLYAHDYEHPSTRETVRAALPVGYGVPPLAHRGVSRPTRHRHDRLSPAAPRRLTSFTTTDPLVDLQQDGRIGAVLPAAVRGA